MVAPIVDRSRWESEGLPAGAKTTTGDPLSTMCQNEPPDFVAVLLDEAGLEAEEDARANRDVVKVANIAGRDDITRVEAQADDFV